MATRRISDLSLGASTVRRHRRLIAWLLCAGWLNLSAAPIAADPGAQASSNSTRTSRWWKLTCPDEPAPCVFAVRLHDVINQSRLKLIQEALRRRDTAQRSLHRSVALRIDVDSPGGEVFAALEIGRLLRREMASVHVGRGASCISACVFVLMGASERDVSPSARIGLHRPSLGDARGDATLVPAMADAMARYAEEMGASRRIVDDMLAIRGGRVRFVGPDDLASYGVPVSIVR